jgi:hypothetical protein
MKWRTHSHRHPDVLGEKDGRKDRSYGERGQGLGNRWGGHGGVSVMRTSFTNTASTSTATSAATIYFPHISLLWFQVHLSRFFVVSGLSRHNSSTIPSRELHDRFLNRYCILGFHKIEHHHLGHEDFDYATLTSLTTLEVEDGLARTPCPHRVE